LRVNPVRQEHYLRLLRQYYPEIEYYFPVYSCYRRPHGYRRAVEVVSPVYPGYLFVRVGEKEDLRGPVGLPVRARWVRFGGKVEVVSGIVVERLRRLEVGNELVREVKNVNPYVSGARVRVHLPVQDIMAVVVKLVGGNRAVVDSDLCRVLVPIHALEVV
jgi:hypothetical protein